MNDAQPDADTQRDSAHHRAPHKITLVHLTEQREHQQPRRRNRNQRARVTVPQMSRRAACAQGQCNEIKQTQCPLQREIKMKRSDVNRKQRVF